MGLGLLFYILLGFRYVFEGESGSRRRHTRGLYGGDDSTLRAWDAGTTWTPQVGKIMAFMAIVMGLVFFLHAFGGLGIGSFKGL